MYRIVTNIPNYIICLFPLFLLLGAGITDVMLSIVSVAFLIRSAYKKDFRWIHEKWVQIALFFWIYIMAISFIAIDFNDAFKHGVGFIRFIFFGIALEHTLSEKPDLQKYLLIVLSIVLTFAMIDTYYQYFFDVDLFGYQKHVTNRLTGPIRHLRIGGYLHYLLYPALLVSLYFLWKKKSIFYTILGIFLMFFTIMPIILSGERVQIPLLYIGFISAGLLWKNKRKYLAMTSILVISSSIFIASFNHVTKDRIFTETAIQLNAIILYLFPNKQNEPIAEPILTPPVQKPIAEPNITPPVQKSVAEPILTPPVQQPVTEPNITPPVQKPIAEPTLTPPVQKPVPEPILTPPVQQPVAEPILTPPVQQPIAEPNITPPAQNQLAIENPEQINISSQEHYIQIWTRSFKIFLENPLLGVGIRNFQKKCVEAKYGPTDNIERRCGLHSHNFYVELLVETGIIGVFIILILLATWIYKMIKLYPLWQNLPIQIGLVTCFIISFFPFLPTRSFFNNWRMALLWFIIGWLLASLKSLKSQDKIDK